MGTAKVYKNYVYIAGLKVPYIDLTINSSYGRFTSLTLNVPYSPYLEHLHPFTKINVFEQIIDDNTYYELTLEFDGILVNISRQKNILGQVGLVLTCLTDGYIWERRKQLDFYLQELMKIDPRGTGTSINVRADGNVTNYFTEILKKNNFDIGVAAASILTCSVSLAVASSNMQGYVGNFTYNGKQFIQDAEPTTSIQTSVTPDYYVKYLSEYGLAQKVYGISTSVAVKNFFLTDQFINMITQNMPDIHGENSFYAIAQQILNCGFYQFFDIANPTYIPSSPNAKSINIESTSSMNRPNSQDSISDPDVNTNVGLISVNTSSQFSGVAEYVFKPISVLGMPLQCNVIFPDQVIAENLSYDFSNSPTRVLTNRHPIPGNDQDALFTSIVVSAPAFTPLTVTNASKQYFYSLVPTQTSYESGNGIFRDSTVLSAYEKAYGIKYDRISLSYAFDEALLHDTIGNKLHDNEVPQPDTVKKLNNYLNYEFAQKFFSSRQYSIQVTPDVGIVIGLPVVVMNKDGQHVIAFCTGITKYHSALGQKVINLTLGYPHYSYENVGALGNLIDPTSSDPKAMAEMATLFGSKPLSGVNSDSTQLEIVINSLLTNYLAGPSDNKDTIKQKYSRHDSICKLNQFLQLHGKSPIANPTTNIPDDLGLFDSTLEEDNLSTNIFKVYDCDLSKSIIDYSTKVNWTPASPGSQDIVNYHLDWVSRDQRI